MGNLDSFSVPFPLLRNSPSRRMDSQSFLRLLERRDKTHDINSFKGKYCEQEKYLEIRGTFSVSFFTKLENGEHSTNPHPQAL